MARILLGLAAAALMTVVAVPGAAADDPPTCNGLPATIIGTDGDDRIEGAPARDVISAGAGKDVIFGRDGNDVICGGPGNDVIKGGRGNDYAEGNQGNDKLVGGIGRDTLDGGNAKDRLFGGGGPDTLIGGGKRDIVFGEVGADTCDLDRLDFYVGCERGDVLGVTGFGTVDFDIFNAEGFDIAELVDYVLSVDLEQGQPVEAGLPVFVIEFYYNADPTAPGTLVTSYDFFGEILTFHLSSEPSGIVRQIAIGLPGDVEVIGTDYFEWLVVHPDLVQRRPASTAGDLPDVFRLETPLVGPIDYELTFDPEVGAFVDFFPGPVGSVAFDSAIDGETTLSGTLPDGVWAVAVDAEDWTLTLGPVG